MHSTTNKPAHPDQGPTVQITINRVEYEIHRGRQTVESIKALANIPPADELEQVVNGNLEPLPDTGAVTLKGGELFLSHPRDGGSS